MNRRGQVAALFVLLIPIFVMLFIIAIDLSNLVVNKIKTDNINRILIDYALDKIEEENLEELLSQLSNKNDSEIEISILKENDVIKINLSKKVTGIITKRQIYNIKSNFIGYFDNDKKIIKRIKGDSNE